MAANRLHSEAASDAHKDSHEPPIIPDNFKLLHVKTSSLRLGRVRLVNDVPSEHYPLLVLHPAD